MKKPKFSRGKFIPKNPEKYIGTYPIIYRSSWELVLMHRCDQHPNIQKWASESIKIPYWNPYKKGAPGIPNTIYVPDFLMQYIDKNGKQHVDIVEIKPLNQTIKEKARGARNKILLSINKMKWKTAQEWCAAHGYRFRVMTEADMFTQLTGIKKRKKRK